MHRVAGLVPEGHGVGHRIVIRRVLEIRRIDPHARGQRQIRGRPPFVLRVDTRIQHVERLHGLGLSLDVGVTNLEAPQGHGRDGAVRIGQVVVRVRVPIGRRVVDVDTLRAGIEHVG